MYIRVPLLICSVHFHRQNFFYIPTSGHLCNRLGGSSRTPPIGGGEILAPKNFLNFKNGVFFFKSRNGRKSRPYYKLFGGLLAISLSQADDERLVCGLYIKHQLLSPVTMVFKKFGPASAVIMKSRQQSIRNAFCSGFKKFGIKHTHIFLHFKSP